MNRVTALNRTLKEQGYEAYRQLLLRAVRRKRGDIQRTAFDLGVSRRHLYRALVFAGLWEEVVAARASRPVDLLRAAAEL